ncbi:hypothetical protein [Actimicrobium antarcticum]|uniref:Flp family type IVb pilin n=1 Tax=Actimicrobium antarcticum TaxID=1051899 RepID=A0ABP7TPW3_9BURK
MNQRLRCPSPCTANVTSNAAWNATSLSTLHFRPRCIPAPLRRRLCQGQSMVEYIVVCGALALTLGIGMADNTSILWQLVDAFQIAYRNFSYAISLPG